MQLISNAHAWHMFSDPVATTRHRSHSTMWRLLITCSGVLLFMRAGGVASRCMHNAHCWYGAVVTVLSHVLHVVARCRDPAAECLTQSDETLRIGRRLGRAPGPLGSYPRICSGMRLAVNSCHSMLSAFHQLRAS